MLFPSSTPLLSSFSFLYSVPSFVVPIGSPRNHQRLSFGVRGCIQVPFTGWQMLREVDIVFILCVSGRAIVWHEAALGCSQGIYGVVYPSHVRVMLWCVGESRILAYEVEGLKTKTVRPPVCPGVVSTPPHPAGVDVWTPLMESLSRVGPKIASLGVLWLKRRWILVCVPPPITVLCPCRWVLPPTSPLHLLRSVARRGLLLVVSGGLRF